MRAGTIQVSIGRMLLLDDTTAEVPPPPRNESDRVDVFRGMNFGLPSMLLVPLPVDPPKKDKDLEEDMDLKILGPEESALPVFANKGVDSLARSIL